MQLTCQQQIFFWITQEIFYEIENFIMRFIIIFIFLQLAVSNHQKYTPFLIICLSLFHVIYIWGVWCRKKFSSHVFHLFFSIPYTWNEMCSCASYTVKILSLFHSPPLAFFVHFESGVSSSIIYLMVFFVLLSYDCQYRFSASIENCCSSDSLTNWLIKHWLPADRNFYFELKRFESSKQINTTRSSKNKNAVDKLHSSVML